MYVPVPNSPVYTTVSEKASSTGFTRSYHGPVSAGQYLYASLSNAPFAYDQRGVQHFRAFRTKRRPILRIVFGWLLDRST